MNKVLVEIGNKQLETIERIKRLQFKAPAESSIARIDTIVELAKLESLTIAMALIAENQS